MQVEYLIVGQGLTGTLLASVLKRDNRSFILIDDSKPHAASKHAAGLINPVTGRRYVKSWKYDELEVIFTKLYDLISIELNTPDLLQPHLFELLFSSVKEENDFLSQSLRYGFETSVQKVLPPDVIRHRDQLTAYSIKGYRLDVKRLLTLFRARCAEHHQLYETRFDFEVFKPGKQWHTYEDIIAEKVVFCQGVSAYSNPYFERLGLIPNKGQLLMISTPAWSFEHTIKDQLILSSYGHLHWVGATYEWQFDTEKPTEEGKAILLSRLHDLLASPYTILEHLSGIRPTTRDRRAVIAQHPMFNNLWAINGLGAKGSSIGPYLIDYFLHLVGHPLQKNEFAPQI